MFSDSRKAQVNSFAHHRVRLIYRSKNDEANHSPRAPRDRSGMTLGEIGILAAISPGSQNRPQSCRQ